MCWTLLFWAVLVEDTCNYDQMRLGRFNFCKVKLTLDEVNSVSLPAHSLPFAHANNDKLCICMMDGVWLIWIGSLHLVVELISANTLSETFITLGPSQNSPNGVGGLTAGTCYDRDKQAWSFEADTHSDSLRVRVVYRDVRNVPRNHIRYSHMASYFKTMTAMLNFM